MRVIKIRGKFLMRREDIGFFLSIILFNDFFNNVVNFRKNLLFL